MSAEKGLDFQVLRRAFGLNSQGKALKLGLIGAQTARLRVPGGLPAGRHLTRVAQTHWTITILAVLRRRTG